MIRRWIPGNSRPHSGRTSSSADWGKSLLCSYWGDISKVMSFQWSLSRWLPLEGDYCVTVWCPRCAAEELQLNGWLETLLLLSSSANQQNCHQQLPLAGIEKVSWMGGGLSQLKTVTLLLTKTNNDIKRIIIPVPALVWDSGSETWKISKYHIKHFM